MTDGLLRARAIFDEQIRCILADDRERQLLLYAEDCLWEFPFATDRPRHIEGREEIARVMRPLWANARKANIGGLQYRPLTIHDTADPDVIVAEFFLSARGAEFPFAQVLRARDGKITHLREYAPHAMQREVAQSVR